MRQNTALRRHDDTILAHMQDVESCMMPYLHEPAQAEDGVIETALLQVLLSAGFHLHERNLRMLVAVVDGEEHVPLNAHCLQHHDAPV